MNTKLTLTIEKDVIERAKKYAKETGRSLSELIQNYLDKITTEKSEFNDPELNEFFGILKVPPNFDIEEYIRTRKEEKYLK